MFKYLNIMKYQNNNINNYNQKTPFYILQIVF